MTEYLLVMNEQFDPGPTKSGGDDFESFEIVDIDTPAELQEVTDDPAVSVAVPDMSARLIEPFESTATAQDGMTWGVEAVGADSSSRDGSGVTVAVLDTGIDRSHEAFKDHTTMVEKDFTGEGNGDPHGHGTHCAGTIFGGEVDGLRIGVAPGVERVLIAKVLGASGGGGTIGIARAIMWAIEEGANVVSMSLGVDFPGQVKRLIEQLDFPPDLAASRALQDYRNNIRLYESIAKLANASGPFGKPCVLIGASGNESERQVDARYEIAVAPPAASDDIIAVGAIGRSDDKMSVADFSNTEVDIVGPGVGVVSAKAGGGLKALNGTSMATPHAAGVAALWVEHLMKSGQNLTAEAIRSMLIGSGTREDFDIEATGARVGTGLVQAPQ